MWGLFLHRFLVSRWRTAGRERRYHPPMGIVRTDNLCKTYRVADKQPGVMGTLRHAVKRKYREIQAVKDVTLSIEPGEVVGFLGPNGAGKTTTLKMLTGLIHPTAGTVRVAGQEPFKRHPDLLRQITLVMGNKQQMIWDLPPMDSLRINAGVYGIADRVADERINGLAELLEVQKELTQPVRKLSLGQRMKCELIAALLHHPKVLFLDEPTLGLDINAQTAVRSFLKTYNQEQGAAVLLTSHYMADITAMCERVVIIDKGSVRYDGSLAGVIERFAPYRELKLETAEPVDRAVLEELGEVESHDGQVARVLVDRQGLTETVQRAIANLAVTDLTVTDPPIEDVLGKMFKTPDEGGKPETSTDPLTSQADAQDGGAA